MNENEEKVTPFKVGDSVKVISMPNYPVDMSVFEDAVGVSAKIDFIDDDGNNFNILLDIDSAYPQWYNTENLQQDCVDVCGYGKECDCNGPCMYESQQPALTRASEAKPSASDVGAGETLPTDIWTREQLLDQIKRKYDFEGLSFVRAIDEAYFYGLMETASLIAAKDKQIAELRAEVEQLKGRAI